MAELVDSISPPLKVIKLDNTVYLVPEKETLPVGAILLEGEALKSEIPTADHLSEKHPFYGRRVLSNVPAGMPDIEVDDNGVLRFVTC